MVAGTSRFPFSGRLPNHELGVQNMANGCLLTLNQVHEKTYSFFSNQLRRLTDRREGNRRILAPLDVIKADDGDVGRNA